MRKYVHTAAALLVLLSGVTDELNGNPASRQTDTQSCPLFCGSGTTQQPHVGGPITTGEPSVIICGQAAARVGDLALCQCNGAPVIASGSQSVLIGGQPAARQGSSTTHGGTVVIGCNSVLIGN